MRPRSFAVLSLVALFAGCARPQRPPVMARADEARSTPGVQEAESLAPQGTAHAARLRADADAAWQRGDRPAAEVLSEQAVAAYEHAVVLARIARANGRASRAKVALADAEKRAADTESDQRRVQAETRDLEMRLKVLDEAEPLVPSAQADPAREDARVSAARALALDATMLCNAAEMLGTSGADLAEPRKTIDEVSRRLASKPHPAPIDGAMRARAGCLAELTAARRRTAGASTLGRADELLAQLSATGKLEPSRDERGVVVTLRDLFAEGPTLSTTGSETLHFLARVAVAHPEFPVQVFVHGAQSGATTPEREVARERDLAESVARSLVEGGAPSERIRTAAVGGAHPIAYSGMKQGAKRNERVEIVFVDPGG